MKKLKLSISDEFGNIDFDGSPIWKIPRKSKYSWQDVEVDLGLSSRLVKRLEDWQKEAIRLNELIWDKEERVKCEIEGLAILLELRKELPDYEITYSSNFNSYNCVLNEEQIDDNY
jgi:hypothetical protein